MYFYPPERESYKQAEVKGNKNSCHSSSSPPAFVKTTAATFWDAAQKGGRIDQGIGAIIKPLTPHLNEIRNLLGEDPWKDSGVIPPARRDPLVLDLNRDGKVELKNATYFDLNANGFHEKALLH